MAAVFISYATPDTVYADRLYSALCAKSIDAWYAPARIETGENFAQKIGDSLLGHDLSYEDVKERAKKLADASVFVLLLSENAMKSKWVGKELVMAINESLQIIPIQIDNNVLTVEFKCMLDNIQILSAYHLSNNSLEQITSKIGKIVGQSGQTTDARPRITYNDIGVEPIISGDPFYTADETVRMRLSNLRFFLKPPVLDNSLDAKTIEWAKAHFSESDELLDTNWEQVLAEIPISDLKNRIESSRKKIFYQFLKRENGCYYNNKKYGINDINIFERTEDYIEEPILTIELYLTDYFTHRVMKDVCKQLILEKNSYITNLNDFTRLGCDKIFFTSLGINLLLIENAANEDPKALITSRSTNAAETYNKHELSVSVIEGVSISDYDHYLKTVSISSAVYRGVNEELGVEQHMLAQNTLKFYNLFVNRSNLEMGLACSVELDKRLSIQKDIIGRFGKDEQLEISDKKVVRLRTIGQYAYDNKDAFLPQALFTIFSYLESIGTFIIDRYRKNINKKETFLLGKDGKSVICGDALVDGKNYIAVIDGATPKGMRLWDNMPGDVFISQLISHIIYGMDQSLSASEAIKFINDSVKKEYTKHGVTFDELLPAERLQASILIYSVHRSELWNFGDCLLRINGRDYTKRKKADALLSDLRAFCIEAEIAKGNKQILAKETDFGREKILPFLKEQTIFANTDYSFGYDVIDGGNINLNHISVYTVQSGDRVIMASDGYPVLFDSLSETENYLMQAVEDDSNCVYSLRGTKGIQPGNQSYDDRTYVGFTVK